MPETMLSMSGAPWSLPELSATSQELPLPYPLTWNELHLLFSAGRAVGRGWSRPSASPCQAGLLHVAAVPALSGMKLKSRLN